MRCFLGAFIVLALVAPGVQAQDSIEWAQYRRELKALQADWRAGRMDEVRRRARALRQADIVRGNRSYRADPAVLDPFIGETDENSESAERRLEALLAELEAGQEGAAPPVDRALLERLRQAQALESWKAGGEVDGLPEIEPPPSLAERVKRALRALREGIRSLLRRLWRFLLPRPAGEAGPQQGLTATLAMLSIAGLLLALLVLYLRRRGAPDPSRSASGRVGPAARDADPRSRSGGEWERYARELAAQGRAREALRAWFHAVLATLYQLSLLHYRRDRTNWEYARAIAPDAVWRSEFIGLTEGFERHWYGAQATDDQALATYAGQAQEILSRLHGART